MWKSFRVAVAPFGTPAIGLWGGSYQKLSMTKVERDDTGRWDAVNYRWAPVITGEAPRLIIIHGQLVIDGGIIDVGLQCNCKIMRNGAAGHGEPLEPVSGVFGSHQGMAAGQMTYIGVANPGDYFEVWTMCGTSTGSPPLTFPGYGPGTFALDTHYAHSFMQGAVYDGSDVTALQTAVLASQIGLTAAQGNITTLQSAVTALQGEQSSLTDALAALTARVTALEPH